MAAETTGRGRVHPGIWEGAAVSGPGPFPGGQTSFLPPRAMEPRAPTRRPAQHVRRVDGRAGSSPNREDELPGFPASSRLFRFRPCRAPPPPALAFCEGWLGPPDPEGYGCCGFREGGVAGRGGAGKHRERLRGARGAASSVYEAHGRGAAQPGWRPPPGGATLRPSHSQVPASPSPALESVLRAVTPGHLPERTAPEAVLLQKAALG